MKSFWSFVGLIAGVTLIVWVLFTYVFVSDEDRILRVLERARRGVEGGSIYSVASVLSANYQDSSGLGKGEVMGALQDFFRETKEREIRFGTVHITLSGEQAEAQVQFAIQAQTLDGRSRFSNPLDQVEGEMQEIGVGLAKEGRSWIIVSTHHL